MAVKKTADQWFAEYGEDHQHPANKLIHWVCVPTIFFSVLGFIWMIPVPDLIAVTIPGFNWVLVAMAAFTVFYATLSPRLSVGLLCFMALCYLLIVALELYDFYPVWQICAVLFVLTWSGQFIGHRIEGRKPSFFQDIVFLLIGPAWLMSFIYKKVGQRY